MTGPFDPLSRRRAMVTRRLDQYQNRKFAVMTLIDELDSGFAGTVLDTDGMRILDPDHSKVTSGALDALIEQIEEAEARLGMVRTAFETAIPTTSSTPPSPTTRWGKFKQNVRDGLHSWTDDSNPGGGTP